MKKLFTLFLLTIAHIAVNAQTFPQPGATWIFDAGFNPWVDVTTEKWEYIGETIVPNGAIKQMKVTRKIVNPGWYPGDTTITEISFRNLFFVGDTVKDITDPEEVIIANFSLQVGDSTYSPYHHSSGITMLNDNDCDYLDSLLIFQKGIVTEVGIDNQDGLSASFYKLEFRHEMGDTVSVKFSQRSLITSEYWWYTPDMNFCNIIFEAYQPSLICYYDSSMQSSPCPEISWFDNLSVGNNEQFWTGKIYPNPASDVLIITNPAYENLKAYITDIQGRKVMDNIQLSANATTTFPIENLSQGVYVLNIVLPRGRDVKERFLKIE